MPFPALAFGTVMGALQEHRAKDEARKQAAANILQQRAAAAGATTYGVQAQNAENQIERQTPDYAGDLIAQYMQRKKKDDPAGGMP